MPDAAFDMYAGNYEAALSRGLCLSGEPQAYFARARIQWLAARLRQHGCRPARAIDYGCGTGSSARELLEHLGLEHVTGVDASAGSIELARRTHANPRISFRTTGESAPAGGYELAYCNGVFHHIEPADRREALAYVGDALSPRGFFAFWENNPWNPGTRLVMRRIPFDRDAQLISARKARALLRAAGFEILGTDFLFFFPRALAPLRPLEASLSGVPAGAQYMVLCRKRT